ncbi:MAG: carbohydrate kinase [Bacteroidaceae bacterium]|nr:carbohydrate kinase [Bacteroidaceae bacterium]
MRRIFGIGETVYDILFRDGQPIAAVPGGSVFNGLISLGRTGMHGTFISEVGADKVGRYILDFLHQNGINTDSISCYEGKKTAVSLAFLNHNNDAEYSFYKDYPNNRLEFDMPVINQDDIVMLGSYFVLNPVLRSKVAPFLEYAHDRGAILYYDINFRSNHCWEVEALRDTFISNYRLADIIRGSHEDFINLYGQDDTRRIYDEHISPYCPRLIYTMGADGVKVIDGGKEYSYESRPIKPVSTIGAGDNFNAGIVYGLIREGILKKDLDHITPETWSRLIEYAIDFGTEACLSTSNYVSKEFAEKYKIFR